MALAPIARQVWNTYTRSVRPPARSVIILAYKNIRADSFGFGMPHADYGNPNKYVKLEIARIETTSTHLTVSGLNENDVAS
jgi:hypothetical protein